MEEIKETVVQVLDKQGVLATLKAQLRACVFAVVDGHESGYGTDLEQRASNAHKAQMASTLEGKMLLALVHEFLAWTNMNYALKVYEAEAGLDKNSLARDHLCQQMGLDHSLEEPVLLTILHKHMSNGDPTSSPRIAAMGKSSIAAKPGGHTVNISASAMQQPLKQTSDIMKATHYPTPPSVPAAAAAAAAMHAGAQHQRSAQVQGKIGSHLQPSSPLSMHPSSSHSPAPTGPAPPGETPQVSQRQLAAAQQAAAWQHGSATRSPAVTASASSSYAEVPMIRQVAPESSSPSLQPSISGASVISEDIEYDEEDSSKASSAGHASNSLTTAAVKAHTNQQAGASDMKTSPLHSAVKQQQSAGLQSPGSSVSPSSLGLSLSVPNEANRKIFAGQQADITPIKVAIPTELNRKAFPDSRGGLMSPGDNSTVYEPESLSASARSSPVKNAGSDDSSQHSPSTSPAPETDQHGRSLKGSAELFGVGLIPKRLNARLPPLAPLQASPARKSAEQIRQELREQEGWFDETDESAEESVGSPLAVAQTWKVHQGLGASHVETEGIMNAAFFDDDAIRSPVKQQQDTLDMDAF